MREELLGYLLGALDADERERMERKLAQDPALRDELERMRSQLQLLQQGREEFEPPGDLLERTCHYVALSTAAATTHVASRDPLSAARGRGSRRVADLALATGVCVAMATLFFPAVLSSREESRRLSCQNNLRQLGVALAAYGRDYGSIPPVPRSGKMSFAGASPILLFETGFLDDRSVLLCAGSVWSKRSREFRMPRVAEVLAASGERLQEIQEHAAGNLAFNLGTYVQGRLTAPRMEGRPHFVLAGDAPSMHLPQRMSVNHGGRGMNLLFEDGHVLFVSGCCAPGTSDDVLRSLNGFVEAGRVKDDSVIGHSSARP
jgi:prepilin-type processing-associated H-X9-DG protein